MFFTHTQFYKTCQLALYFLSLTLCNDFATLPSISNFKKNLFFLLREIRKCLLCSQQTGRTISEINSAHADWHKTKFTCLSQASILTCFRLKNRQKGTGEGGKEEEERFPTLIWKQQPLRGSTRRDVFSGQSTAISITCCTQWIV